MRQIAKIIKEGGILFNHDEDDDAVGLLAALVVSAMAKVNLDSLVASFRSSTTVKRVQVDVLQRLENVFFHQEAASPPTPYMQAGIMAEKVFRNRPDLLKLVSEAIRREIKFPIVDLTEGALPEENVFIEESGIFISEAQLLASSVDAIATVGDSTVALEFKFHKKVPKAYTLKNHILQCLMACMCSQLPLTILVQGIHNTDGKQLLKEEQVTRIANNCYLDVKIVHRNLIWEKAMEFYVKVAYGLLKNLRGLERFENEKAPTSLDALL